MLEFHKQLAEYTQDKDTESAHDLLMSELGKVLATKKADFVELLVGSGVQANETMSNSKLIDLFVKNIPYNKQLMIGTAFLINSQHKVSGFDGEDEVSDAGTKASYKVIDDFYNAAGDPVTAIAQGVGELSKLGTTIAQGRQKKKFGVRDIAEKQLEARNKLAQAAMEQQAAQQASIQKESEQKAKNTRTMLIVGGAIAVVALIAVVIYARRRGK